MKFTIEQIREAHAKVKSGTDFPMYIRALKNLGLQSYRHYVSDGHTDYFGSDNYIVNGTPKYPTQEVSLVGSAEELKAHLKIHQSGGTDYATFCRQAAEAGVEKWIVDLNPMTCTYYDRSGNVMITEMIPD